MVGSPSAETEAIAKPMTAKIIRAQGKTRWRASADSPWNECKVDEVLAPGVQVRTGLRSSVSLEFRNAQVLIDSNSDFEIPTIEQDGNVLRTIAQVKSGRADFQVDKAGLENDFKVVTPSTTLAVRGTGFAVINGAMAGTEITGSRTNAMAAIAVRHAATQQTVMMSGGGGESKSSSEHPEPATGAMMSTIGPPAMAGTTTSSAERVASATIGTSQPVVQAQASTTIGAVAAVHADTAAAASGDGGNSGSSLIAVIADLVKVAGHVDAARSATTGAASSLTGAALALERAQGALAGAQQARGSFEAARANAIEAAQSASLQLEMVNEALVETQGHRSSALEFARLALVALVSGPNGGGDTSPPGGTTLGGNDPGGSVPSHENVLQFVRLAQEAAEHSQSSAQETDYPNQKASELSELAFQSLDLASVSGALAEFAAQGASEAADEGAGHASDARMFLELVDAARREIEAILARRPLPAVVASLQDALGQLEVAAQHVINAESARDGAAAAAMAAHALAQGVVLEAVEQAALAAAQDAIDAAESSAKAHEAAEDAQSGTALLDSAIASMLEAEDQTFLAAAQLQAVEGFRQLALAKSEQAAAQIAIHLDALGGASEAQLDAASALMEALGYLDQAIANSGLTTDSVEACFEALASEDINAATEAAHAAREFADATMQNSADSAGSAQIAGNAAQSAATQASRSIDARDEFVSQLVQLQGALWEIEARAELVAQAASAAGVSAEASREPTTQFIEQVEGENEPLAQVARGALDRALALAQQASDYASAAFEAYDDALAARREVFDGDYPLDPDGNPVDFQSTLEIAQAAQNDANAALDAARAAEQLALLADAEAYTAQAAVGAAGEGQVAGELLVQGSEIHEEAQARAVTAGEALEEGATALASAHGAAQRAHSAGAAASQGTADAGAILIDLHGRMESLIAAIHARNLDTAMQIREDWMVLEAPAEDALARITAANYEAQLASDEVGSAASAALGAVQAGQSTRADLLQMAQQLDALSGAAGEHAGAAVGLSALARAFADAAIDAGSTRPQVLDALAQAAVSIAQSSAGDAQQLAALHELTGFTLENLEAMLGGLDISVLPSLQEQAQADASHTQEQLAQALGVLDFAERELQTADHAIDTLDHTLDAQQMAIAALASAELVDVRVQSAGESLASTDVVHQNGQQLVDGALEALGRVDSARDVTLTNLASALEDFNAFVVVLGDGNPDEVLAVVDRLETYAALANDGFTQAQTIAQDVVANEPAALNLDSQMKLTLDTARNSIGLAHDQVDSMGELAVSASGAANLASLSAQQAEAIAVDSQLATRMAVEALALSQEALSRANLAMEAHAQAQYQVDQLASMIDAVHSNPNSWIADDVHNIAAEAIQSAGVADASADSTHAHASLANAVVNAIGAANEATIAGVASEGFMAAAVSAGASAGDAVAAHLDAVADAQIHFDLADAAADHAQSERDTAIEYQIEATDYYQQAQNLADAGVHYGPIHAMAVHSDQSAHQSDHAADRSDGYAVESRAHADVAAIRAVDSAQAQVQYETQLELADGAAAHAGGLALVAGYQAGEAQVHASAAQLFEAAIASARSNAALQFALNAQLQASVQRNLAAASHEAAMAAAQNARSMGDRVFFTRTAEIAAAAMTRANEARAFADEAIAAAALARADADAALALHERQGNH